MLTVILLVVLAGGAAALAVWLVDPSGVRRLLGRTGALSLRPAHRRNTPPSDLGARSEVAPSVPAVGGPDTDGVAAAPTPVPPVGPVPHRRGADVPAAFTAVEGPYRDVAVAPVWRKAFSLILLVALLLAAGAVLAAVAAAVLAAAAELVDGAVE